MSELLCLPQSPRMDLYPDVSDVKPFSRICRPKLLVNHLWETPEYDFSENASMYIKARVSEIMQPNK